MVLFLISVYFGEKIIKMQKVFHLSFDKETAVTFISGFIVILLSISMLFFPNNKFVSFLLRDILMILVVGYIFPLYYIKIKKNKSLSVLGIHKQKLGISLLLNIIFAISLLTMFIKKKSTPITFTNDSFYAITYILAAGIFEMIYIYGFLRYEFERAFGIFPSIILTSVFYSFHHAGFQPEFYKLFFVGILYCSTFYITQNIFVIFPFYWAVGAVWDVLVNSTAGKEIKNIDSFLIAIFLILCMIIFSFVIYKEKQKIKIK